MNSPEMPPLFDDVEPVDRVRGELVDLYMTPVTRSGPRPAVVFVHGGPVVPDQDPRDWPGYAGYATLAAASGLVGIVLRHHLYDEAHLPQAADDVAAALEYTRGLDCVDPDRLGLWFFSLGGPLAVDWMRAGPPWLRFLVWTYPVLAPPPDWDGDIARFDAVHGLAASRDLPKLLMRVEHEFSMFIPNQDAFVDNARARGAALDVITIPEATHGFEGLDHYPEHARGAVHQAMDWASATLRN